MKIHHIPYHKTGYFSNLINDYVTKNEEVSNLYGNYPEIHAFKNQIALKAGFEQEKREVLASALVEQYKDFSLSEATQKNIESLKSKHTFTVTTGHQLNIFTGPLYFIYKIISTINLTKKLKKEFPDKHFVPVYWMATEDHDFEEINYFNVKGTKISWKKAAKGAVGRLKTEQFEAVQQSFFSKLNNSQSALKLKDLFVKAYVEHDTLASATRFLVNELFNRCGLVIVDGDCKQLKTLFKPQIVAELAEQISYKHVSETNKKIEDSYKIQVNPREINLFYLKDNLRERIVLENEKYKVLNSNIHFSKEAILEEVEKYPERFSPNVITRPAYQEVILPNLCYIGGGGELAYWLQLKSYFNAVAIPFPIVLLRNSVLFISEKQSQKMDKLNISFEELFLKQEALVTKKIKEISAIKIDFSEQRSLLQTQFNQLKELAKKTDFSFVGAVNAQEKKQLNGLDKLEKRLLKAQKKKLDDVVERIVVLHNQLFPNGGLEERIRNFSDYYLEFGEDFLPMLMAVLDPLKMDFTIIEV